MKIQDLLFLSVLILLIVLKRTTNVWHAGIIAIISAGVLFSAGNLFTAQRLAWYAWAFISVFVVSQIIKEVSKKEGKS